MRPYLIILIFLSSTVFARYQEKTRFDRSIHDETEVKSVHNDESEKKWSFTDVVTQFVAYRSKQDNDCYIENVRQDVPRNKRQTKVLYASTTLTKLEAWRLAGGRIVDFCQGRSIILLQTNKPIPGQTLDPFMNEIPTDENDIVSRRVADVVLTPLRSRARREIQLERRKTLNKKFDQPRRRRQTNQFRGKFRGQTQSQYLNVGSGERKEGKAEAESTQQSSRAVVSGSRGMGQAQSMSSSGTGCEDCPGYSGIQVPSRDGDRYVQGPGVGIPTIMRPGTGIVPGIGGVPYPGGITPGAHTTYPGGAIPGGVTYPGAQSVTRPGTYPGGVQPGIVSPGGVQPGIISPGGVQPGIVGPGGVHPGVITPGTVQPGIISPGGVQPGAVSPGSVQPGVMTPGTVQPGMISPGRVHPGAVSPGSVQPGVIPPGSVHPGVISPGGMYPGAVSPGSVQPGVIPPGSVYPGVISPGGVYPGAVSPGSVQPGVIPPESVHPGVISPGAVQPGIVAPGGDEIYPPGTLITGRPGMYPGSVQPGGVQPGSVQPGTTTGVGTYPGVIQPGAQPGQIMYPSAGIITSVTTGATITGGGTYPGVITPGTGQQSGGAQQIGIGETYPGTGIHPGNIQTGTISGTYPSGVVPEGVISQRVYPGGTTYPGKVATVPGGGVAYPIESGGQVPGMATTGSMPGTGTQIVNYPSGRPTDGQVIYPAPGNIVQPGRVPDGTRGPQIVYPGTYPGGDTVSTTYPGGQPQVVYPGGSQQVTLPSGTVYPGQQIYPGDGRQGATYPGTSTGILGTGVPGTIIPGRPQYPVDTTGGQITTGGIEATGQYPGRVTGPGVGGQTTAGGIEATGQYPGRVTGPGVGVSYPGVGGPPDYTQIGPGGPTVVTDDGAESQALSSVQQESSGTQASASAQGRYGQGTAQSQVTGTYSGSGTFSAQAGTNDANKSVLTEISGGKEGATSNAQGVAGYGKSQAQVQLNSNSGATSTGAQSSGWNHGTNSQVQASSKGGMADAQANGEGSTSSQAQIGFQPYLKTDEKLERHASPFRGSGTASAQSGTHRGQSQSQLQGAFQYGITYTGAAQAGSGSGAASSRKPFNFSVNETELFKPFNQQNPLRKSTDDQPSSPGPGPDYENKQDNHEQSLQGSSTSRQTIVIGVKNNPEDSSDTKVLPAEKPRPSDTTYDEYDDDYGDDYYDSTTATTSTTKNPMSNGAKALTHQRDKVRTAQRQSHQTQTIQVPKGDRFDVHVSQDSNPPQEGDVLQPGQSVMGYTVPPGFRGRVMSISGVETIAQGDGKSQSQTVSLVPKNSTKPSTTQTRSLHQTNHERHVDRQSSSSKNQAGPLSGQEPTFLDKRAKPSPTSVAVKPSYYTVTNSVAGKMNGNNAQKQYEHRYYTKSSTCGYFTFSCNVVYGSNGRTKICKPKAPTYPDGTPMRC